MLGRLGARAVRRDPSITFTSPVSFRYFQSPLTGKRNSKHSTPVRIMRAEEFLDSAMATRVRRDAVRLGGIWCGLKWDVEA